jgi:hypothetical protein
MTDAASAEAPVNGVDAELVRAASALLSNLWQDVWSHERTHEENWKEFDRKYPGVKWLRDARDAALDTPPASETSCDEQLAEAKRLAANVGHMVVPDPVHGEGVNEPAFVTHMQPSLRALGFHAVTIEEPAAEAALSTARSEGAREERQRCLAIVEAQVPPWVKERSGPYWDGYREAMDDAAEDMRKGAAAIRAQGETG